MQPTTLPAQQGVNEFSENNTHQQNLNLLTNRKKISGLPSDNERKQLTTDDIKNLNLEKKVDERHDTLLMHAVEKNDLDIRYIKKILNGIFKVKVREGINNPEVEDDEDRIKNALNAQNLLGDTALHKAIRSVTKRIGRAEFDVVELLLKSNTENPIVDTTISNRKGESPIEMLKKSIENNKMVSLSGFVQKGHYSILKTLLENENEGYVDQEIKNSLLKSALNIPLNSNKINMVELLLKNGAKCESAIIKANTNLNLAAEYGAITLAKNLIEGEGAINFSTPLQLAAKNGHSKMVDLLINEGADPTIPGTPNPLFAAIGFKGRIGPLQCYFNDEYKESKAYRTERDKEILSIVKTILAHPNVKGNNAFINQPDNTGKTPFILALDKKPPSLEVADFIYYEITGEHIIEAAQNGRLRIKNSTISALEGVKNPLYRNQFNDVILKAIADPLYREEAIVKNAAQTLIEMEKGYQPSSGKRKKPEDDASPEDKDIAQTLLRLKNGDPVPSSTQDPSPRTPPFPGASPQGGATTNMRQPDPNGKRPAR